MPSPPPLGAAFRYVRAHPREVAREVRRGLADKRVVSHASAISYQLLFALVAFTLASVALLSLVGLADNVWQHGVRSVVHHHFSPDAFRLVDGTVRQIEGPKRNLWLTVGLALSLWKLSVAARVTMDALDEIYETHGKLPARKRFLRSIGLGVAAGTCLLTAAALVIAGGVTLGHLLPGAISFVLRWGVALALMLLAAGLILRYAPSKRQPAGWVSVGTVLVVLAWGLTSFAFGIYAASIANWKTLFGGLATVIAILLYLYVSAIAFLVAAQLDLVVRKSARATGREEAHGQARGGRQGRREAAPDPARAA